MGAPAISGIPVGEGTIISVPFGSNTVYRGSLVYWASGQARMGAVGVASQTDATLFQNAIGFAVDSTEETNQYGEKRYTGTIRVVQNGKIWVRKETPATAATLGQFVTAHDALPTAERGQEFEAGSTAADALGRVLEYDNPWMLVDFDFRGNVEQA